MANPGGGCGGGGGGGGGANAIAPSANAPMVMEEEEDKVLVQVLGVFFDDDAEIGCVAVGVAAVAAAAVQLVPISRKELGLLTKKTALPCRRRSPRRRRRLRRCRCRRLLSSPLPSLHTHTPSSQQLR